MMFRVPVPVPVELSESKRGGRRDEDIVDGGER